MSYLEEKALYRRNRFKISIKNGMLQVNVKIFALICCDRTMIATSICDILLLYTKQMIDIDIQGQKLQSGGKYKYDDDDDDDDDDYDHRYDDDDDYDDDGDDDDDDDDDGDEFNIMNISHCQV